MTKSQSMMNIFLLVFLVLVLYFMMIRPQKKRDKEAKEMRDSLTKGDEIVTIGGFIGRIVTITNDTVVININAGKGTTNVEILKSAISTIKSPNTMAREREEKKAEAAEKEKEVKTSTTKKVTPKKLTPKKEESVETPAETEEAE